jgi:hypothetical protein
VRVGYEPSGDVSGLVEETSDGLLLSTVAERAHQARRVPLAIAGSVVPGPCPSGSPDPRVRLA